MKLVYFTLVTLLCIVIEIQSQRTISGVCNGCQSPEGYTRIKRAKYYSSPPQRFYKRPPMTYPIKGAFSYTPPPGYMMEDDEQPPPNLRPKVSKRPTNEGLRDEDINNIVKYLSKQDLDKIIEFANEKERESPKYTKESYEKLNYITNKPESSNYDSRIINPDSVPNRDSGNKFSLNGPYVRAQEDVQPYDNEYNPNGKDFPMNNRKQFAFTDQEPTALFINNNNKINFNTPLDSEESMQSHQFSFFNAVVHKEMNQNTNTNGSNIFTDSSIMQEEQLPKPLNLREPDYDISYTNNVPTVVKADSDSYKVENLGELPLMNYHSKLDTVDSYRVPHYTVTSPGKYGPPAASASIPPVEPAPPVSSARDQSDAHLKAIKIWTHKSKGTAYTLHDDGSLSLERPSRPKTNYGYP